MNFVTVITETQRFIGCHSKTLGKGTVKKKSSESPTKTQESCICTIDSCLIQTSGMQEKKEILSIETSCRLLDITTSLGVCMGIVENMIHLEYDPSYRLILSRR